MAAKKNGQQPQERAGHPRKTHPLPLRLRHGLIKRQHGGSEGYRGRGWPKARLAALNRDKKISTTSGLTEAQGGGLQVDHIQPFRLGGKNRLSNLRTVDVKNHRAADSMNGGFERIPKRDARW